MKVVKVISVFGLISLLLICGMGTGCSSTNSPQEVVDSLFLHVGKSEIYYDLKEPKRKYFLPYVLAEVSGLSYKDPKSLLMVEDEGGMAYEFNLDSNKVVNSTRFSKPGDFEGIEFIDDTIYTLRSNGTIYKFPYSNENKVSAKKFDTPLTKKNNTEGLGFDPVLSELLILTKESGDYEGHKVKGRAVYAVNPASGKFHKKEVFNINNSRLEEYFERVKGRDYEKDRFKFEPSAIAVHPIDHNYYVLASVGKLILVINRQGEIISSYPILPRILNQPEGICFSPAGDLYISSEGEGDRGYILHYEMLKK